MLLANQSHFINLTTLFAFVGNKFHSHLVLPFDERSREYQSERRKRSRKGVR